jgi:hypothetical protein
MVFLSGLGLLCKYNGRVKSFVHFTLPRFKAVQRGKNPSQFCKIDTYATR